MKQLLNNRLVVMCLAAAGAGLLASSLHAQDKKAPDKEKPATTEKKDAPADPKPKAESKPQVKKDREDADDWMTSRTPGEHHKKLDSFVGTWNLEVKYADQAGPGSKGKSEFKWVMDGRFLVETTKTEMAGRVFEWMGWHGYANRSKEYVSVWADNFDTDMETMTGKFDDAKKTLTYVGESDNPLMGGKITIKWIMRLESKDRFITEMYESDGNGREKRVMEIIATRG